VSYGVEKKYFNGEEKNMRRNSIRGEE